jgi:branched-chain amino acid transport system substrate-binding protein
MAYTGIDVASDAALPLYVEAGIPFVTSNSWGDQQRKDPGAFILHAAGAAFTVAPLSALKGLGVTKIAVILEDSPAGTDFLNNIAKPVGEEKLGLEIEAILVDPAAPDYATAVATAQSAGVEAIWGQLTEPGCLGLVQATAASGFEGPIFAGSCSFYIAILPDQAVGTYTQSDIYFPDTVADAPPEIQERLAEYGEAMTAAGAEANINGFAAAPYSAWFEIRPILESIVGEITSESIIEAFQTAGTTPGWLGPDLHCGETPWPSEPAHCSGEIAVWRVEKADDGSLIRTTVVDFENPYELTL